MKKNYTLIIATILLLLTGFAPQTWAVEYVLNTNPNVNINSSSKEFTLSCPGETLTFDLALAGGATGSVTVEEYDKDHRDCRRQDGDLHGRGPSPCQD